MKKSNTISAGISFPTEILKIIDIDRGDISRSKYIMKVLNGEYEIKDIEKNIRNNLNSLEDKTANLHHSSEFSNP
jgi:hypothetical protein